MEYEEILANARKTILNCKACPECNGLGCGNTLPGPGSKAPGNGAHDNWQAWKSIKLNIDTFAPNTEVDTSFQFFHHTFKLPLLTGPIGSLTQYSKEDVTGSFNNAVMQACKETGVIDCFGDGLVQETVVRALASVKEYPNCAIPVLNPLPNGQILEKIRLFEGSPTLALSVVVDSAGLSHWKFKSNGPGSKTTQELKELKAATKKPFIIKGIMTARSAVQAVEAGADAIIVSNHGGRVMPDVPSTAEVLPEIAHAVKGSCMIIVDGGIRHGSDMVKALALGADAVLICRPFAVSWFGGGVEGVKVYIEKLQREFMEAMYMVGARKLSDLTPEMVRIPKQF